MTRYLLAGGGTAGHVNPLLAVADALRVDDPTAEVLVLGTKEGLEARLVPERGYELATIPRLPFPRRPGRASVAFPAAFRATVRQVRSLIADRGIDAVVGFGGYASAPAYLAATRRMPLSLHEANARPGMANRLGASRTKHVGVAFPSTRIANAHFVGMPLRREIVDLDRFAMRDQAREELGLDERPTLLVTGGSLGARRLNTTMTESAAELVANGYQVLHIAGREFDQVADPGLEHYHLIRYSDRMELALAVADLAISRAGSATVSELTAIGVPAVYVPYPVGNGEQRFNAADAVKAGAALIVPDEAFLPSYVSSQIVPLLGDPGRLSSMSASATGIGIRDGAERMVDLIHGSLGA